MPKFPFTNYHELNLDWILKKVNALFDASEENARTIRTYDTRLNSAEQTAASAATAATSAQQLADAAAANADNALSVAGTADAKADSALTAATDASSAVSGVLIIAQEAQQTAGAAVATANDAAATASGLESLANTANQNATAAVETAGIAVTRANNAAAAAQTADQKAVAAQETANSAQTASNTNAGNITTLQTNVTDLNRQISAVKSTVNYGYVNNPPVSNGSFNSDGTYAPSGKRIRTDFIPVKTGDKIDINNGSLKHACGAWRGTLSSATNIRNDGTFSANDETIVSAVDGYYVVVFAKQDTSQNISVSDFDGSIHLYSNEIFRNTKRIDEMDDVLTESGDTWEV